MFGAYLDNLEPVKHLMEENLGWEPPQLVVIGVQSSEKSSLLETLIGLPIFPETEAHHAPFKVSLRRGPALSRVPLLHIRHVASGRIVVPPIPISVLGARAVVRKAMETALSLEVHSGTSICIEHRVEVILYGKHFPILDVLDLPDSDTTEKPSGGRGFTASFSHYSSDDQWLTYGQEDSANIELAMISAPQGGRVQLTHKPFEVRWGKQSAKEAAVASKSLTGIIQVDKNSGATETVRRDFDRRILAQRLVSRVVAQTRENAGSIYLVVVPMSAQAATTTQTSSWVLQLIQELNLRDRALIVYTKLD